MSSSWNGRRRRCRRCQQHRVLAAAIAAAAAAVLIMAGTAQAQQQQQQQHQQQQQQVAAVAKPGAAPAPAPAPAPTPSEVAVTVVSAGATSGAADTLTRVEGPQPQPQPRAAAADAALARANQGPPLRVLCAHRPPLMFVQQGDASSPPMLTGILFELFTALLQQAQITRPYEIYAGNFTGGVQLANGSWSGVMGELTSGRADVALFPLTLTASRAEAIEHTAPFMDSGYGMLVALRQTNGGYSFLLPFEPSMWAVALGALVATVVLLYVLDVATRRARLKAWCAAHGVAKAKAKKRRRRDKLMAHGVETIMMAVGSGAAPTAHSCGVKILFIAWAVTSIILLSTYTANLAATLTVSGLDTGINSLSDLAMSPLPFGVPAQSSVSSYFSTNSSDHSAAALAAKVVAFRTADAGVEALRQGKLSAFISDYAQVQYYTQAPPCDLTLTSEILGSGALVIGLAPDSPLVAPLNRALLQLNEAGFMAELKRRWLVENSQCGSGGDSGDSGDSSGSSGGGTTRLSLKNAWSVFIVLAVGMGLAIFCAALEVLYYRRCYAHAHPLRKDAAKYGVREALRLSRERSRRNGGGGGPSACAKPGDADGAAAAQTASRSVRFFDLVSGNGIIGGGGGGGGGGSSSGDGDIEAGGGGGGTGSGGRTAAAASHSAKAPPLAAAAGAGGTTLAGHNDSSPGGSSSLTQPDDLLPGSGCDQRLHLQHPAGSELGAATSVSSFPFTAGSSADGDGGDDSDALSSSSDDEMDAPPEQSPAQAQAQAQRGAARSGGGGRGGGGGGGGGARRALWWR